MMTDLNAPFFLNPNLNDSLTDKSTSSDSTNHDNFLIVRSLKNKEGSQKGYIMEPGDIVKLGRIEYLVLETKDDHGI